MNEINSLWYRVEELGELGEVIPPASVDHLIPYMTKTIKKFINFDLIN